MCRLITVTQGHVEEFAVKKTKLFCPNCGVKGLLQEEGDGDYYTGPMLYCLSCQHEMGIPILGEREVRIKETVALAEGGEQ